jgi:hypothetical protein
MEFYQILQRSVPLAVTRKAFLTDLRQELNAAGTLSARDRTVD